MGGGSCPRLFHCYYNHYMQPAASRDPRFPVGKFEYVPATTAEQRDARIRTIAQLPAKVSAAVQGISEAQLETPYREGGWTVRQVVHHFADSHANALIRFKLALTEETPTIKPYAEDDWAKLADSALPIEPSLQMLQGVHTRLVALMRSLSDAQWQRAFLHPQMGPMTLEKLLALYAWHSDHHFAHIQIALNH